MFVESEEKNSRKHPVPEQFQGEGKEQKGTPL